METIASWDGTLSSSDFRVAAFALIDKWKSLNRALPLWLWIPTSSQPWIASSHIEGYLGLEKMCLLKSCEESQCDMDDTGNEEPDCSELEQPIDDALLVVRNGHEAHYFDFHIVFSASYRVPVLYFRTYHSDGQPLTFDEIEKDLPAHSMKVLMESKWTFITQEEHPYLNRPWYKLHPCGTCEWMKLLFLSNASFTAKEEAIQLYLVSWLSVVGQVFGLRIPSEMVNCS